MDVSPIFIRTGGTWMDKHRKSVLILQGKKLFCSEAKILLYAANDLQGHTFQDFKVIGTF